MNNLLSNAKQVCSVSLVVNGEKITIKRTVRSDAKNGPYRYAVGAIFRNGSFAIYKFHAELEPLKKNLKKLRGYVARDRTDNPHPLWSGAELVCFGCSDEPENRGNVTVEIENSPVEWSLVEADLLATDTKKTAPKSFETRAQAREYCKAQGVPQSKATKTEQGWIVDTAN